MSSTPFHGKRYCGNLYHINIRNCSSVSCHCFVMLAFNYCCTIESGPRFVSNSGDFIATLVWLLNWWSCCLSTVSCSEALSVLGWTWKTPMVLSAYEFISLSGVVLCVNFSESVWAYKVLNWLWRYLIHLNILLQLSTWTLKWANCIGSPH